MILIIDNYDSFVYNLARYAGKLDYDYIIKRNDKITLNEITAINPKSIIISPGPCTPTDAGICIELIQQLGAKIPILGVCLGHQAIGEAYGGKTPRAKNIMHGKSCLIRHDGSELFNNIPTPMEVGRYHSLISDISDCNELIITAHSESNENMAIRHKTNPVFGVQFHPESVLTPQGIDVMNNFLLYSDNWHKEKT